MKEKEREIQKLKEEHHLALSRISHEIRNPVTLINSSMQLIEAEHPEVLSFDLWDDMKKDMLFLRRLLDELSGYNNGEKIHPEALELSSFLREIASNARLLSPDPNIRFSTFARPSRIFSGTLLNPGQRRFSFPAFAIKTGL